MLLSNNNRGMCNRLKSLVSVLRRDPNGKILWCPTKYLNCRISHLFTTVIDGNDIERYRKDSGKIVRITEVPSRCEVWSEWRWWLSKGEKKKLGIELADWLYEDTPKLLIKKILPVINKLVPIEQVQKLIRREKSRIPKDAVGVQVRRWQGNSKKDKIRRSKFPMQGYLKAMDKLADEGKTFYLTYDSADLRVLYKFKDRYGKRLIHPDENNFGMRDRAAMQAAVADMFVCASLPILIGNQISSFPEFTWWISQCRTKVIRLPQSRYMHE